MGTFRPNNDNNVCKLNFDDKFFYELPLHEDTNLRVANIANEQLKALKELEDNATQETYNKVYNISLDALDDMLGEGAGAQIMSLYEKPSLFDIGDIIHYITKEYGEAYNKRLDRYKANGTHPAQSDIKKGRR